MQYMNEHELSEILCVGVKKLRADRHHSRGIPYVKIGRCVRYRREDVEAYLAQNFQSSNGHITPTLQMPSSEPAQQVEKIERGSAYASTPKAMDWKRQLVDAMQSMGIISEGFTGKITLEISNGILKSTLKQEEL